MVRKPYIDKKGLKRGAWSEEEDNKLRTYILRYKAWNWNHLPRFAGLARCGKSCRMRWENYLKPGVKRGGFSKDDEEFILKMQKKHGNKWSLIAKSMPGRTDNEIKNYWHTILSMRIKQNQNSIGFMENAVETSEEEMDEVDQTKNVSDESIQDKEHDGNAVIVDSLSTITFSEAVEVGKESNRDFEGEPDWIHTMLIDASHNQILPTTNADSPELYGDELMVENYLCPNTFSPLTSQDDTVSSCEKTLLVNSSNTEEASTTYAGFTLTDDLIMNLEESFFAAPESFTLEPFLMDKNNSYSSASTSTDFCPRSINIFPSSNSDTRFETHDSWSPAEIFSTSPECISTEPSSTDASNRPFLHMETSTLLGRLESMESFGFWKALWNILK